MNNDDNKEQPMSEQDKTSYGVEADLRIEKERLLVAELEAKLDRGNKAAKVDDAVWPMAVERERLALESVKVEKAQRDEIHPLRVQEIASAHASHVAHAAMANSIPGFHEDLMKHCRRVEVTLERHATAWEQIAMALGKIAAK